MIRLRKKKKTYHYDIHLNGKRYRGTTFVDNKETALLYARRVYDELYAQKFGIGQQNILICDVIETHLMAKQGHFSSGWLYTNRKLLEKFAAFVQAEGAELLGEVTTEMLEAYKTHLLQSMKPISVKNNFRVINALFNYAIKLKYISDNPAKRITPLRKITVNKQRFLSQVEIATLLKRVEGHYFADLAKVAVYTGMRRQELTNLEYEDVDVAGKLIYVRNKADRNYFTKSRKERTVPIHEKVLGVFSKNGKGYCFTGKDGRPICPKTLTHGFKAFAKQAGFGDVGLHTLRHTFASHLAMRGVPLFHIAQWMGHSTTRVTELYAHLCQHDLGWEEIDKLNF